LFLAHWREQIDAEIRGEIFDAPRDAAAWLRAKKAFHACEHKCDGRNEPTKPVLAELFG
jgi:hypothetical protein